MNAITKSVFQRGLTLKTMLKRCLASYLVFLVITSVGIGQNVTPANNKMLSHHVAIEKYLQLSSSSSAAFKADFIVVAETYSTQNGKHRTNVVYTTNQVLWQRGAYLKSSTMASTRTSQNKPIYAASGVFSNQCWTLNARTQLVWEVEPNSMVRIDGKDLDLAQSRQESILRLLHLGIPLVRVGGISLDKRGENIVAARGDGRVWSGKLDYTQLGANISMRFESSPSVALKSEIRFEDPTGEFPKEIVSILTRSGQVFERSVWRVVSFTRFPEPLPQASFSPEQLLLGPAKTYLSTKSGTAYIDSNRGMIPTHSKMPAGSKRARIVFLTVVSIFSIAILVWMVKQKHRLITNSK